MKMSSGLFVACSHAHVVPAVSYLRACIGITYSTYRKIKYKCIIFIKKKINVIVIDSCGSSRQYSNKCSEACKCVYIMCIDIPTIHDSPCMRSLQI